jgi:hypothetical protein
MTIRFSSFLIVAIPCLIGCDDMLGSLLQTRQVSSVNRYQMQSGNEWEDRYRADNFSTAYVIKSRWGEDALRETLLAMLRGEPAISGGALWLSYSGCTYLSVLAVAYFDFGLSNFGQFVSSKTRIGRCGRWT